MNVTYLAGVLIGALSLCGCNERIAHPWLTEEPVEGESRWTPVALREIPSSALPEFMACLEDHSLCEIPEDMLPRIGLPSGDWFLCRAVAFQGGGGMYGAFLSPDGKELGITYGRLGTGPHIPIKRSIAVELRRKPERLYVCVWAAE